MVTKYIELFSDGLLRDYLDSKDRTIEKEVDGIQEQAFLSLNDIDIVEHVRHVVDVEPLQICPDDMAQDFREETGRAREFCNPRLVDLAGNEKVRVFNVRIELPFTGDALLWSRRPSNWGTGFPTGRVSREQTDQPGILEFGITSLTEVEPDRIKQALDRQMESIRYYLEQSRKDIDDFRKKIPDHIREAIVRRRKRLEGKAAVVAALNIPLMRNPNAPDLEKVPLKRKIVPPLPAAKPSTPEWAISDENYEYILKIIRHEGATFETARQTFAKLNEEDVRNIILAHLNGHLEGQAKGEAFRKKGRTDILIEYETRFAFVAECKNWGGEKVVQDALTQLLGYLTWRDCKTALILFNTSVAGFTEIQQKVAGILQTHPWRVRILPEQPPGEWRAVLHSRDDPQRRNTVHVFLFDLYTAMGEARNAR